MTLATIVIYVPLWETFFVFMVLCALWWLKQKLALGRQVSDAPHCGHCLYNLTGIDGATCPECGGDVSERGKRLSELRTYATFWIYLNYFLIGATGLLFLSLIGACAFEMSRR